MNEGEVENRPVFGRRWTVSILVALFGISSWIEVNGLWVELPLLLPSLPEGGLLASYIVVLTQAANLGPLLYSLARFIFKDKMPDNVLIHCTMLVGTTSSLLLIWFWDRTSYIGGENHSTAFFTLAFFLATVDCTSSVLYLPFVGRLRKQHLLPFLIGEGLSGVLPALVALAQGVGGNPTCEVQENNNTDNSTESRTVAVYPEPRFSVETFFIFLVVMLVVSWASFIAITFLPATVPDQESGTDGPASPAATTGDGISSCTSLVEEPKANSTSTFHLAALLVLQAFICCLTNGILPAIQAFSCLPYGNVAYHLSVTLSSLSNPLACLLALRWRSAKSGPLGALTSVGLVCAAYLISTAALSPTPPLVNTRGGEALLILSWILFTGSLSYAKAMLAWRLRQSGNEKALFYVGVFTQIGSFVGAISSFTVVQFTNVFAFYTPCS